MSLPCNNLRATVRLISIWLIGAAAICRADEGRTLDICIDSASPTASLDSHLAAAALRTQHVKTRLVPFVGVGRGGDGFPVQRFAQMAAKDCQLIMGFPVDITKPQLPPGMTSTQPYARTGFVVITRASGRRVPLTQLPVGSEVGIAQLDTYAGTLFALHPSLVMHVYRDDAEMVADLDRNEITAGLAWQPNLRSLGARNLAMLHVEALDEPHMRWDLVALYLPETAERAALFERGVALLRSQGRLQSFIAPFKDARTDTRAQAVGVRDGRIRYTRLGGGRDLAPSRVSGGARNISCAGTHGAPSLYTEAQAAQGAVVYAQNCAACHGPRLEGQPGGYTAPALRGKSFADPSYNFHVSDIFNFVSKLMPAPTPGSLSQEQDVQVMSFLLKENGYPAGSRALTYEQAQHSRLPLRFYAK